nr:uncharacterized protein LOC109160849 [Ipomoea batatas]GMD92068.1 uncharacterized protein LOC109160849 [Ipomoea batatas]GMD92069.1 uncharacterized protein LOC109160849 [Ipomoea batatas]
MGSDLNIESAIKALQKSVKALELQHDKIENLSTTVASLSTSSLTQAASLANLEKLVQQLLTSLGKQPVQEEDSVTTVPTEGISTMADIGHHYYRFSRYPKVEFPLFSGEEDPMVWLLRCESSFRHADTPDHKRVPLAAHHMIGEAQLWYHSEIAVSPFASWASFKEECCLSFGPPRSINTLGELKLLFQSNRHIDDYVNDFRAHLARASTVLPAQRVDLFTGGLDEVLRIDVERAKPSSLNEAINTARDFYRKCHVIFECDSKEIVEGVVSSRGPNFMVENLLKACAQELSTIHSWRVTHVAREQNKAADKLAHKVPLCQGEPHS